jgi:hypothetical protein
MAEVERAGEQLGDDSKPVNIRNDGGRSDQGAIADVERWHSGSEDPPGEKVSDWTH